MHADNGLEVQNAGEEPRPQGMTPEAAVMSHDDGGGENAMPLGIGHQARDIPNPAGQQPGPAAAADNGDAEFTMFGFGC